MKKVFTILVPMAIGILLTASVFAQSPDKMSYQAVIRNSGDDLVTNTQIGMEINIRQGSPTGTIVYTETQTPTTNVNGLVSIEIGGGTGFNTIDWANGPYFIETKTAVVPPLTTYTITGTSQLLSVPYALHAKTAETVTGAITETDPEFTAWDMSTGISITESQISDLGTYLETESDPAVAANFDFTDAVNGDLLQFNGTKWVKVTPDYAAGTHAHATGTDEAAGFMSATDKAKLDGIADGANANVKPDWDATEGDAEILNKPDLDIYATKVELDLKANKPQYYLGQEHLDGIIFYLYYDENGDQRGLVVSKTETTAKWQNTEVTTNATRSWDGAYNMNLMSDSPAKDWVTSNFTTDWYLLSIDELNILWHNCFHVNKALNDAGATLLSNDAFYWSSTEYGFYAVSFGFYDGNGTFSKTRTCSVRAVRAF